VVAGAAERRVFSASPDPHSALGIFAEALKPMSVVQLEMRSDNPLLQVNELFRGYPETAGAVGKDVP
jgi:hypothetical protein